SSQPLSNVPSSAPFPISHQQRIQRAYSPRYAPIKPTNREGILASRSWRVKLAPGGAGSFQKEATDLFRRRWGGGGDRGPSRPWWGIPAGSVRGGTSCERGSARGPASHDRTQL